MRVFVGYRPVWPGVRAQALQVFQSAHALASRGHEVTVCFHARPGDVHAWFGLPRLDGLRLIPLPAGGTASSLAVRAELLHWSQGGGVVLAREKRLAAFAQRWTDVPVVVEAHEVDSLQGRRHLLDLERRVFRDAAAVITNCEGVLAGLVWMHDLPSIRRVVHNAGPALCPGPGGGGVVYAGSLLADKDLETVARAAPAVGGLTLFGAHDSRRLGELQRLARGTLVVRGPVAPAHMVRTLGRYDVGLVSVGDGWFGRELTSPLKAFTYRSAGLPVVATNTPALQRALGAGRFASYEPGDVEGLVHAVQLARRTPERFRATVRTWAARAAEVESVLQAVK